MLQESPCSKGPGVPTSIQSMQDSIETSTPTLMRLTVDHGILEFSDLGCQIQDSQDLGISGSRDDRPDPDWPQTTSSGQSEINLRTKAGALPLRAWLIEYGGGMGEGTIPGRWCTWPCHPGYTTATAVPSAVPLTAVAGSKSVLWALKRHCVTLKRHLKSIWSGLSDVWLHI